MVGKGNYLFGEFKYMDYAVVNNSDNQDSTGRLYYDYLRQEKLSQRETGDVSGIMDMPFDTSEYNTMFMTF